MKTPDKVKISWRKYIITEAEHRSNKEGEDLYGEIDCDNNKIYIYEKLDSDNKKVTLLHEIIHAIGHLTGNSTLLHNENIIECLSENLYQVFKENPDLLKYLGCDDNVSG